MSFGRVFIPTCSSCHSPLCSLCFYCFYCLNEAFSCLDFKFTKTQCTNGRFLMCFIRYLSFQSGYRDSVLQNALHCQNCSRCWPWALPPPTAPRSAPSVQGWQCHWERLVSAMLLHAAIEGSATSEACSATAPSCAPQRLCWRWAQCPQGR